MRKILPVLVLLTLTACSHSVRVARTPGAPPRSAPVERVDAGSCPMVAGGQGYAAVDYVDFVQAFGHQYLADFGGRIIATATRSDLSEVVLRSRCSFSALNDRTHKDPGRARDGDTGFLPPGTPIYAIKGWSHECRLAAEHEGRLRVYVASQDHAAFATPRPCAQSK